MIIGTNNPKPKKPGDSITIHWGPNGEEVEQPAIVLREVTREEWFNALPKERQLRHANQNPSENARYYEVSTD